MNAWHFAAKQLHIERITASLSDFLAEMFLCHLVKWVVAGIYEPCCEKNGLRGFQPGPTLTRLYSLRRLLEA